MKHPSKAVIRAAIRSVGYDYHDFCGEIEQRSVFVPLAHGSLAIMLPSPDFIQIIGYAGTRKDYQECFDYAKGLSARHGSVPIFAIIFPEMLDTISACGLSHVIGYTKDGKIGVCSESI